MFHIAFSTEDTDFVGVISTAISRNLQQFKVLKDIWTILCNNSNNNNNKTIKANHPDILTRYRKGKNMPS